MAAEVPYIVVHPGHSVPLILTALFGGYLSGSVPYGLILSGLAGAGDIRKAGSGNIGATNVLRVVGKKVAAVTLVLDALKGFVPVFVAKQFGMDYAVIAAFAAFFGHLFPVWLKFKGGKGVATAIGVSFALSWMVGLSVCGVWLIMAALSQYSSLAALSAFGLAPVIALRLTGDLELTATTLALAIIIWVRHHANLKRLIQGTESKISFGKKDGKPEEKPEEKKEGAA